MHFSLFRLYLAIASLIGLVGSIVGFGMIGFTILERSLISDDEYITGSRWYDINSCNDLISYPDTKTPTQMLQKSRTPEEVKKCQSETHDRLVIERAYSSKSTIISGGSWGTLFLLVFLGHFPFFFRTYRKEESSK